MQTEARWEKQLPPLPGKLCYIVVWYQNTSFGNPAHIEDSDTVIYPSDCDAEEIIKQFAAWRKKVIRIVRITEETVI